MKENKLKLSNILGYAVGSIGDCTAYNFVITFFSFFMTTIAGISPAVAGSIISIAIVWDAITDPIVGYMVDHSKSKHGKRRPWILRSLIPLGATLVLMFLNVDMGQTQKNLYYLILVLVFWTGYTAFNIPYYSFGAVLTNVDSERVKLAAYRQVLGYVGVFCASSVPTFIVGKLVERGFSDSASWATTGVLSAIITVVSIGIMWRCTKGREPIDETIHAEKINLKDFLQNIITLMKMKPYVLVIICALFTNVYLTLFNSSLMYYVSFNMGMGEAQASVLFTVINVVSIVLVPFITKAVEKFTKNRVFVLCMVFSGIVMILAKFIGLQGIGMASVYVMLACIGTSAYWMCIFNFLYDVVDYDEFHTGKTRDGIIMSYYSFLLKLGGAVAAALQGYLLEKSGFDPALATQSDTALHMIEAMFTILPGIFMLLAGLVMIITPLKDKKMEALRVALAKKRNGETYVTDGFEDLAKRI